MEELAEGVALADRYLLGPVVGHGAMGEVHLAEDLRLARPVAVKSLRPELARYPEVRRRFGQEARAAARINHPNVVRVYDSGEHGRIPYLVMECLPGSTLVDELAWGPLEPRRARRVALDVLGALDAAHRRGVVHRDVKPGNILLSAALDGPVKVSDFGIAKSADDCDLTDSNGLVGTAAYLAPERVAGAPATPSSDLYSLGVVLYEALAGRRPYEGETSLAVALAIHMGGAPSLLELRPDLHATLASVIDRALAPDPAERWESAAAMAAALLRWRPAGVAPAGLGGDDEPLVIAPSGPPVAALMGRPLGAGDGDGADHPEEDRPTSPTAGDGRSTLALQSDGGDPTERLAREEDDGSAKPLAGGADLTLAAPMAAAAGASVTGATAGRGAAPTGADSGGAAPPELHRRPHVRALVLAGAAALLLLGATVAIAGRDEGEPDEPTAPSTTAELVAGTSTSTASDSTAAPARPVVSVTTRPTRRIAPATTAKPPSPPTTRATTTTAAVTTRPPPSTAPPTAPPIRPSTEAPPSA